MVPLHAYTELQLAQGWLSYIMYGVLGLFCGRVNDALNGRLKGNRLTFLMQLALTALFPAMLMQFGLVGFVDEWQNTTAGLFFASTFFGMQSNLLASAQAFKVPGF